MRSFRFLAVVAFALLVLAGSGAAQQKPQIDAGRATIDFGNVVLGSQAPAVVVPITVKGLGHHPPPTIAWSKANIAGQNNEHFHVIPGARRKTSLRNGRALLARFTCLPVKVGKLTAEFQPTITGNAQTATKPLINLTCTGVTGIASKATDDVPILWKLGTKALTFRTIEVGQSDNGAVPIWNRTKQPIEVYARFAASAPKKDIEFSRLPPTMKKPIVIQAGKKSGFILSFNPKEEGTHGRTLEIGWRPQGSKHGWSVKHHVVSGRAVAGDFPEDD